MDIKTVDLNVLVVFDAMFSHQNVTRAGRSLGLSQPAMSTALSKLRELFADTLFVRTSGGMKPTPLALQLAGPIRKVLGDINSQVLQHTVFDPLTTTKVFSICMPDIAETIALPKIMKKFSVEAPNASLNSVLMFPREMQDGLEAGTLDLAIGYFPDLTGAAFFQQVLYKFSYVCMVRSNHPVIGKRISLKQFSEATHVVVRPAGRTHEVVERYLKQHGISRRVQLNISHFTSLPMVIEDSDLVATVTHSAGAVFSKVANVRLVPAPLKFPSNEVKQHWHTRFHKDPPNIWIRDLVRRALTE